MSALGLWIGACSSDGPPTGPAAPGDKAPAALSLALTSNTWTTRAALPFVLCEIAAGLAVDAAGKSTVYVIGGNICQEAQDAGPVFAYDVPTDTWMRKAGDHSTTGPNGLGKVGSKFYVTGGMTFGGGGGGTTQFSTFAYDFVGDRFIRKADMPKATGSGVTGVIKDKVYVLPGYCSGDGWPDSHYCDTEPTRQLYRYDPSTDTWTTKRQAPHFHRSGAGGVIDHKFYVVGGTKQCCGQEPVAALDVYDPPTNTWTTLAPMPTAGPVIGAVLRGKLFVIPGPGVLYIYDPATNTWKTKTGPKYSHEAATRVMIDGRAYLLAVGGGQAPTFEVPNPSELYAP